ncbi:hypothetical protein [Petrimonas sulfuriphila]|uniref:hypothetical protein n=1 Tax=Petrimonas sulfuriphila TaxID=285070 RepID=UPI003EB73920
MKTEPTEAGDMLYKFAEMRGWDKNKLIGWSEAADFADWFANQSSPKIKPLEWNSSHEDYTHWAKSNFGTYCVQYDVQSKKWLAFRRINQIGKFETEQEGKQACQGNYECRVKECLE